MTRLVSGRIQKIPSANVSAERYQFIEISEVEPDLGLPSALGQVFTSDLNGTRYWINLDTANINETSNLYFTNTRAILALDGADISVGNLISQDRIEGNTLSVSNIFADLITANTIISNTWVNLYSSNVIEFQNLFYTNSRVLSHLAESDVSVQDLTVVGNLIVQGNTTTLNTETLVVEDKNIVIANGAPNPAAADGAGITIEGANATITFVAATDSIEINKNTSILGNIAIGTGLGGSITGANLIVANILVATERIDGTATAALIANVANTVLSLSNFTTTDLAEGNNLYYTNVRVDAYINDFIDTDDISEANNLYYTNARVVSAVTPLLTTANVIETDNLYYTNARVDAYINDFIDTDDIDEANNLYYTNARVVSAVTPLLTTANVIETDNLYYTNARVDAYINDFIDTDDISEANNLYYTNARVLSHLSQSDVETRNLTVYGNLNVVGNLTTINASTLEITDPLIKIAANNETSDAVDFGWLGNYSPDSGATKQHAGVFRKHGSDNFYIFSQYVDEELDSGNLVSNINPEDPTFKLADVYGNVFHGRISTLENHTTDALVEGTNLYYTNTRVVSAVTPLLTTANVFELSSNLYYTNTRVLAFVETLSISDLRDVSNIYAANVQGLQGIQTGQALVWDGNINQFVPVFVNSEIANVADLAVRVLSLEQFTTANIAEASSNLYFTNTRVLDALIDSNVIVNNLFVQGDLTVQGNTVTLNVSELVIEDKNIVLANGSPNANVADNSGITIAGANATILYKESGDKFQFNKNLEVIGNIIVVAGSITNANIISADTFEANLLQIDSIISNVITSGEITVTNSASFANVTVEAELVGNLTGTADFVSTLNNFTTDNLVEGSNLYYANTRVDAYINDFIDTDDITEANNLYYTNDRVLSHLTVSNVAVQDLLVQGDLTVQGNTVTLNVSELVVEDKNILLANGAVNATAADGAGIIVQGANAEILYISSLDSWVFNRDIRTTLVGNVTGFVSSISNHTTDDLTEANNLYYTNARVFANVSEMSINVLADVDITGILNGQVLAYDGAKFVPSPADIAIFSETANIANTALTVVSLSDFTTDDIVEGSNLYYTNSRVRSAFTAGRGIIILENGTIKAKEETELFNLLIDGSAGYYLTDSMESAVSFANVNSKHRYLLRSLHVTNISEDDAYISSNIVYASGNVVALANRLPIPVGGTLEFIKRTQVLNPADSIMFQSFDSTGVAANNLVSSIITYETADQVEDEAFFGVAAELTSQNSNVLLLDSFKSYSILESIKLVNLEDFVVRAKVFWTNANNSPKAYFSYNIPLPPNSSVELLQGPKRIEFTDRIFASINSNSRVSAFVSGKYGSIFEIEEFTLSTVPGNIILASFSTTEDEGETLYYTIE